MRTVKVYSTREGKVNKVETSATTWGELRPILEDLGYYTSSMRAVESSTKVTLEHSDIKLPTGDFLLMMVPKESKAGADYILTDDDIDGLAEVIEDAVREYLVGKVEDPDLKFIREGLPEFLSGLPQ